MTNRDKKECQLLDDEYIGYMDAETSKICEFLDLQHDIDKSLLCELLQIALAIKPFTELDLGRQQKRRKRYMLGWFGKNWEDLKTLVESMVIVHGDGSLSGSQTGAFQQFRAEHENDEGWACLFPDNE
jgi:hypothetical protein